MNLAHANDSETQIKDLLKQNKSILKKCDIHVKDNGKKLKFFDDMDYHVDKKECVTTFSGGETEISCSPKGDTEQEILMRDARLRITFNEDGEFQKVFTSKNADGGFSNTYTKPTTFECDESGETIKTSTKSPLENMPNHRKTSDEH